MTRPPIATFFLTALCAVWLLAAPLAHSANFVNLALARWDDGPFPTTTHGLDVQVVIPDVTGVTAVNLTLGNGTTVLALEDIGSGTWITEEAFIGLANAQSALDGTWEIDIVGSSPSKTDFSFTTPTTGFFTPPTITNPTQGDVNVPQNTTFTWDDPNGVIASDFLFVFAGNDFTEQENSNVLPGSLSIIDTSWTPPNPLASGFNEFDVIYVTPFASTPSTGAGAFNVNTGSVTWSDSPFDPSAAAINPGLGIGGWSTISFSVVPEPSTCGLALLASIGLVWQRHRQQLLV